MDIPDRAFALRLTITQVAQVTGQSYVEVQRQVRKGQLPAQDQPRNGGRRRYIMTLGDLLKAKSDAANNLHNLLLSTSQAARLGGVPVSDVVAKTRSGELSPLRQPQPGAHRRYRLSDVLEAFRWT